MSDTIPGALISAGATILVALLGRMPSARSGYISPHRYRVGWYVALGVLAAWFVLTPGLLHHDWAGYNFWTIAIATLVLAMLAPVSPLTAAWMVPALYAANFILGPLSNLLAGSSHDADIRQFDLVLILLMALVNAAIVPGLCALRLGGRKARDSSPPADRSEHKAQSANERRLASELEKLKELHSRGALTDDEFKRAKKKLLES